MKAGALKKARTVKAAKAEPVVKVASRRRRRGSDGLMRGCYGNGPGMLQAAVIFRLKGLRTCGKARAQL